MAIQIRSDLIIPDRELQLTFGPSGGPGGQHANRSNTRAILVWDVEASEVLTDPDRNRLLEKLGPTIRISVDDERSQARNRDLAHQRLSARVQAALHQPRKRRPTKPTYGSKRRRLDAKKRRGATKRGRSRPSIDD